MSKNYRVTLRNKTNGTIYMEQYAENLSEAKHVASTIVIPHKLVCVVGTVIERVIYQAID